MELSLLLCKLFDNIPDIGNELKSCESKKYNEK